MWYWSAQPKASLRSLLLLGDLTLPQFIERLAIDAKSRRRPRFQAFESDLDAATIAVTVFAVVNLADGFVDFLDELALAIAIAQFQSHIGLLAGAVIRIREYRRLILHRVHGAVDVLGQLDLQLIEDFLEVLELLRAHVLLALFRHVRLEIGTEFGRHFRGSDPEKCALISEIIGWCKRSFCVGQATPWRRRQIDL